MVYNYKLKLVGGYKPIRAYYVENRLISYIKGDYLMDLKLCESDFKFMEIVWEHAPVRSGELVKLCADHLGWKKPTTYTIIRKMSEKGFIKNESAVVSVLIGKEQCQRAESEYVVESRFRGSLPSFITAFLGGKSLSAEDAAEIRSIVDKFTSENDRD